MRRRSHEFASTKSRSLVSSSTIEPTTAVLVSVEIAIALRSSRAFVRFPTSDWIRARLIRSSTVSGRRLARVSNRPWALRQLVGSLLPIRKLIDSAIERARASTELNSGLAQKSLEPQT